VILVVVEGSPARILSLITAIKTILFKIKYNNAANKRLDNWWFTSAEWFHQTYQQYLDPDTNTAWLRQATTTHSNKPRGPKPKPTTSDTPTKLKCGPDPHIWVPLNLKADCHELMEVDRYTKGKTSQPPKLMSAMKALPIPAVFNSLHFSGADE